MSRSLQSTHHVRCLPIRNKQTKMVGLFWKSCINILLMFIEIVWFLSTCHVLFASIMSEIEIGAHFVGRGSKNWDSQDNFVFLSALGYTWLRSHLPFWGIKSRVLIWSGVIETFQVQQLHSIWVGRTALSTSRPDELNLLFSFFLSIGLILTQGLLNIYFKLSIKNFLVLIQAKECLFSSFTLCTWFPWLRDFQM